VLINKSIIAIGRVLLITITPELSRLDRLSACLLACLPAGLSAYLLTYEVHWYLINESIYFLAVTAADRDFISYLLIITITFSVWTILLDF
jgi:hypothetical protein